MRGRPSTDPVLCCSCREAVILIGRPQFYNSLRPHRSLSQRPPSKAPVTRGPTGNLKAEQLRRSDVLGGLIDEYRLVA
jgi:putative transposase